MHCSVCEHWLSVHFINHLRLPEIAHHLTLAAAGACPALATTLVCVLVHMKRDMLRADNLAYTLLDGHALTEFNFTHACDQWLKVYAQITSVPAV